MSPGPTNFPVPFEYIALRVRAKISGNMSSVGTGTAKRGHFLELSFPADDVRESLEFYQRLGFTELPVNDIRKHYYAAVTDGRISIGLHGGGFDVPALSFVWPDVARHAHEFQSAGYELAKVELGADKFHEAELTSPGGHALRFMEAGTFSRRLLMEAGEPLTGRSAEISLRCTDYAAEVAFWQGADFIAESDAVVEAETPAVMLFAPGVRLGLRTGHRWAEPSLLFRPRNLDATLIALDRRGIAHQQVGAGWLIAAPEGTRLILADAES